MQDRAELRSAGSGGVVQGGAGGAHRKKTPSFEPPNFVWGRGQKVKCKHDFFCRILTNPHPKLQNA